MKTIFAMGIICGVLIISTLLFAGMCGMVGYMHPAAKARAALAVPPVAHAMVAKPPKKTAKRFVDDSCYTIPECLKWRDAHYPIIIDEIED
jgi:hypothetical protein